MIQDVKSESQVSKLTAALRHLDQGLVLASRLYESQGRERCICNLTQARNLVAELLAAAPNEGCAT